MPLAKPAILSGSLLAAVVAGCGDDGKSASAGCHVCGLAFGSRGDCSGSALRGTVTAEEREGACVLTDHSAYATLRCDGTVTLTFDPVTHEGTWTGSDNNVTVSVAALSSSCYF